MTALVLTSLVVYADSNRSVLGDFGPPALSLLGT